MKALMKLERGPGHLELVEMPEPHAGPGEVVLRVASAGICGTDLHIAQGEFQYWPPVVLGHEFTGTVIAVGDGVDHEWIGSRVVCEPHPKACGQCYLCRRGHIELCSEKRATGRGTNGAFASQVAVPAMLLHGVPSELSDRAAVLAEPAAIVLTALERAMVRPGDVVVVTGPGSVGLLGALAARSVGAKAVVVIGKKGIDDMRLAVADRLGFVATSDSEEAQLAVTKATDGRGADLLIEASGAGPAIAVGIGLLRVQGRVAAIGLSGKSTIEFGWDQAMVKALDIFLSFSSANQAWDEGLAILSLNAAAAEALVTEFALDDWEAAFASVEQRSVLKAALRPAESVKPLGSGDH